MILEVSSKFMKQNSRTYSGFSLSLQTTEFTLDLSSWSDQSVYCLTAKPFGSHYSTPIWLLVHYLLKADRLLCHALHDLGKFI